MGINPWDSYTKIPPAASSNYRFKADYSWSLKTIKCTYASTEVFLLLMLPLSNRISGFFPAFGFNSVPITGTTYSKLTYF